MNKLIDMLNQYLSQAQAVITKYGPGVWDATLKLIRLESIFDLASLAFFTALCLFVGWKIHVFTQGKIKSKKNSYDEPELFYLFEIPVALGLIVCLIAWCCSFPDWLGAFYPELSVLYHVAQKAGLM